MQKYFDVKIDKLKSRIAKMIELVTSQIELAFNVYFSGSEELINGVIENEEQIDILDNKIDKRCHELFALGQPVAKDLRFIISSLKISNELERIGDISVSIANQAESIQTVMGMARDLKVKEYAYEARDIILKAIKSFTESDITTAEQIIKNKKDYQEKYVSMIKSLELEITKNVPIVPESMELGLTLKQISRLFDHATNIAEETIFFMESKIVKHSRD
jgi:phosphate transport system protein